MVHECPRCGYESKNMSNLRTHFNRKKKCKILNRDLSIVECKLMLENKQLIKTIETVYDLKQQNKTL